ncbi:hypothetical protein BUQ74_19385 [Leptospira weilii serovar Heyan]|nr:hypothetical protein BUQ74_19385 [Leptospira weilii serovar Heyan]
MLKNSIIDMNKIPSIAHFHETKQTRIHFSTTLITMTLKVHSIGTLFLYFCPAEKDERKILLQLKSGDRSFISIK